MKKTAMCFAGLAFLSVLAFAQDGDYGDSFARLTFVKGHVVVQRAGDLGTEEGIVNLALVEGDQLETGDGRAELSFGRKNFLRLDRAALVELSNMPREGDDRVRIHLLKGTVYLRLHFLQEEKTFELHTPDASFYALEEGLYRFDMKESGETELSVIEGSMEAAGEGGSLLVGSRERLIAAGGNLGTQRSLTYGRDDFDHWNADRDALHSRYVSKRYLSSDLEDYEYELADNGRWVYERPYGHVWVPHISINDWRPYYHGRWLWYANCGWTWISYEPWGWCTHHYGRWHWRLGLGWYWIPHRTWGPAWVHWYWGHDYCGWAPLSWYNRPVVLVNNYFYDRYHGARYPGGSHALTVIHRNQLQNRHISSVALSRTEASRLGDLTMQARQPDVRPTLRSSGLQRAVPSGSSTMKPQIRPSTLRPGQGSSLASPSSRISRSSAAQDARTVSRERPSASGSRISSGSLSRSRTTTREPSNPSSGNKAAITPRSRSESSAGSISGAPRRIRTDSSARKSPVSSSAPPTVRSYSSSPRVSSGRLPSSSVPRNSPRTYSPDARISRFGSDSPSRSSRSSGQIRSSGESRLRGLSSSPGGRSASSYSPSRSISRTAPSRSESYPRLRSISGSSSRSVFSAPKSFSPSRSVRSGSPSSSRSSARISSGSRSAPSRPSSPSSSSRSRSGSSGSVKRKN
ncbi:MAG: hypothetical protein JXE07_05500 [Candidatus Aminicenantes bacterium]|nr:hypothetical protein [Candidatus Aminicenantes bacterium]